MRWMLVGMLLLALAGCQSTQLTTPSGRPEATYSAPASVVRPVLVNVLVNNGFTIKKDSEYSLVVERRSTDLLVNVLLGSQWNPTTNSRLTLAVTEVNGQTRVVADMHVVTNPGTGFERLTPVGDNKANQEVIAGYLEEVRRQLGG